jgi:hypothetical protein
MPECLGLLRSTAAWLVATVSRISLHQIESAVHNHVLLSGAGRIGAWLSVLGIQDERNTAEAQRARLFLLD